MTIHTGDETVEKSIIRLLDFLMPRLSLDVTEYEI